MIRSIRPGVTRSVFFRLGVALALALAHGAAAAQTGAQAGADVGGAGAKAPAEGLLGDDFARGSGAIIVTAQREKRSNLFEDVPIPPESCLASAPALGEGTPGFTIDGSGMRRVRDLEKIRKKTKAGTIFVSGGNFVGQDFRKARLDNMCFFNADFSQTDWTGFAGTGLGFVNVDLTAAKMANSRLPYVLLRDVKLRLVEARGAAWQNGQIDGGWNGSLQRLDLTGADLTGLRILCGTSAADGCPTDREGMSLAGANLRRASFHSFYWPDISLTGTRIDQTELGLDHLSALDEALLVGPVVLRSPRRAIMLFPQEVARLAEVVRAADRRIAPCDAADPPQGAMAVMCELPGSGPRALLRSVALLEDAAQTGSGAAEGRTAWLARRDACLDLPDPDQQPVCLAEAYRARQSELRRALGAPEWLGAPRHRLFLSREAAFPTDRNEPGLYSRILPVLLDTAVAAVIVRTDGAGVIAAKGMALGGCAFDVSRLTYDIESAALGIPAAAAAPPPPPRGRRGVRRGARRAQPAPPPPAEPLMMIGEDGAANMGAGLVRASASCEGDNAFPPLEEIILDERVLGEIWERF